MSSAEDDGLPEGLRYVTDGAPGFSRRKSGSGFVYFDAKGDKIEDAKVLDRIRLLAIPPAYEKVWICKDPNGHLQATGFDARGRKQYRYHPAFRQARDENKFHTLAAFGRALSGLRQRVDADMARRGLPKEKVLAVIVHLLDQSLIRVGNGEYAQQNGSFGLTTMLTRHVRIGGSDIRFSFLGKSKVKHKIDIHDRRLARIVRKIQELPGQELFHYLDEDGYAHTVSSADVNAYLKEATGKQFTAKEFRTWWGTLLAFADLVGREGPSSSAAGKRAITESMKQIASMLGNTVAVCRKCYVHPAVTQGFIDGALPKNIGESPEEDLVRFLERSERKQKNTQRRLRKA